LQKRRGMFAARIRYRLITLLTATAALIVLGTASAEFLRAQAQDIPPDVRAFVKKYEDVFNTHNASAVAAFFAEDADMIIGDGPKIAGRKAIQEWWAHYFSRIDEERKGTFAIDSLRFITPEVALINLGTRTAARRSTGEELPTRLARGTWVVVRQAGGWRISALRAFPAVGEVRFRPGTDR
jgi:uncharacterized protein (TIGR02246 family)